MAYTLAPATGWSSTPWCTLPVMSPKALSKAMSPFCSAGRPRRGAALRIEVRAPGDVVGVEGTLFHLGHRIAGVDEREHRRASRRRCRSIWLSNECERPWSGRTRGRRRPEIDRPGDRVEGGVAEREAQAVRRLGVELDVVVEDGPGLVVPGGELVVPVAVDVGHDVMSSDTSESQSPSMSSPSRKSLSAIRFTDGDDAMAPKAGALSGTTAR